MIINGPAKLETLGTNVNCVKRISGGADCCLKPTKSNRRSEADKNSKAIKQKEQHDSVFQPRSKDYSTKQTSTFTLENALNKKLQRTKHAGYRTDSSISVEEAAIVIQAIYRGYQARKNFKIHTRQMECKQSRKRVMNRHIIPVGPNLHKPLESDQVKSHATVPEQNQKEAADNTSKSQESNEATIVKVEDTPINCHDKTVFVNSDDMVKNTRLEEQEPRETCSNLVIKTIMAHSNVMDKKGSSSSTLNVTTTPSIYPSTDDNYSDLPFSKRLNKKCYENEKLFHSMSDGQTRRKVKRNELAKFSKTKMQFTNTKNSPPKQLRSREEAEEVVLVFGGIDPHTDYGRRGNSGRDVYGYKPDQNSWEYVGEMPEPRHHHSVAYLTGRIYLVGGADPREDDIQKRSIALGTVWSYDPRVKNWYNEPSMLTARQNFGLVVSDGKIFAIGGQNKTGISLRAVEVFDPCIREWKEVPPMHNPRVGPGCAEYEGHIWVAGGTTRTKKEPLSKSVECYDSSKNFWFKVEPLSSPRCFSCLSVVSNRLLLVGGAAKISSTDGNSSVDSIGSIDVWQPSHCCWQHQTEISIARHGHTVCTIDDKLLILGGVTTLHMKALKSVECYWYERDKWIKGISPLPFAISGHGAVSLSSSYLLADS